MANNKHERLADRFADIFIRLNSNERLSIKGLSEEYGVCTKTIRRDLARMECYLPLLRERGVIYLDNHRKFDLTDKEFGEFIQLIGIHHLMPNFDISLSRELLKQKSDGLLHIKGYEYENSTTLHDAIKLLKHAIKHQQIVIFEYKNSIRTVMSYKLINHRGCWYVIGLQSNKGKEIKTYRLSKITHLTLSGQRFDIDDDIKQQIDASDGIWFGEHLTPVIIQADNYASGYFIQKQILPNQKIIKSLDDGGLLIQSDVYHQSQLFPMIRSWIPHLTITEPKDWQRDLESGLREYLGTNNSPKLAQTEQNP